MRGRWRSGGWGGGGSWTVLGLWHRSPGASVGRACAFGTGPMGVTPPHIGNGNPLTQDRRAGRCYKLPPDHCTSRKYTVEHTHAHINMCEHTQPRAGIQTTTHTAMHAHTSTHACRHTRTRTIAQPRTTHFHTTTPTVMQRLSICIPIRPARPGKDGWWRSGKDLHQAGGGGGGCGSRPGGPPVGMGGMG